MFTISGVLKAHTPSAPPPLAMTVHAIICSTFLKITYYPNQTKVHIAVEFWLTAVNTGYKSNTRHSIITPSCTEYLLQVHQGQLSLPSLRGR